MLRVLRNTSCSMSFTLNQSHLPTPTAPHPSNTSKCRSCGRLVCDACSQDRMILAASIHAKRVCTQCTRAASGSCTSSTRDVNSSSARWDLMDRDCQSDTTGSGGSPDSDGEEERVRPDSGDPRVGVGGGAGAGSEVGAGVGRDRGAVGPAGTAAGQVSERLSSRTSPRTSPKTSSKAALRTSSRSHSGHSGRQHSRKRSSLTRLLAEQLRAEQQKDEDGGVGGGDSRDGSSPWRMGRPSMIAEIDEDGASSAGSRPASRAYNHDEWGAPSSLAPRLSHTILEGTIVAPRGAAPVDEWLDDHSEMSTYSVTSSHATDATAATSVSQLSSASDLGDMPMRGPQTVGAGGRGGGPGAAGYTAGRTAGWGAQEEAPVLMWTSPVLAPGAKAVQAVQAMKKGVKVVGKAGEGGNARPPPPRMRYSQWQRTSSMRLPNDERHSAAPRTDIGIPAMKAAMKAVGAPLLRRSVSAGEPGASGSSSGGRRLRGVSSTAARGVVAEDVVGVAAPALHRSVSLGRSGSVVRPRGASSAVRADPAGPHLGVLRRAGSNSSTGSSRAGSPRMGQAPIRPQRQQFESQRLESPVERLGRSGSMKSSISRDMDVPFVPITAITAITATTVPRTRRLTGLEHSLGRVEFVTGSPLFNAKTAGSRSGARSPTQRFASGGGKAV